MMIPIREAPHLLLRVVFVSLLECIIISGF